MESRYALLELKNEVEACRRDCPSRGKGAWFFESMGRVKGFLGTSRIMFIAPKPSTGTFPSPNDELFYELLEKHNLQNAHITDWIKCRGKSGSQRDAEFANCLDFLLEEKRIIKPLILVGVGNEAYNTIQGCKPLREGVHCLEHCIHYSAQFRMLEWIRAKLDGDLERISHLYRRLLEKEKTRPIRVQKGLDDDRYRNKWDLVLEKGLSRQEEVKQACGLVSLGEIGELFQRMLMEMPKLGDDVRRYDLKTRVRFEREGYGGREKRIVALVQNENSITAHLPYNRTFKSQVSQMKLWPQAFSEDIRGFSYLKGIKNENRVKIALDVIRIAYKSLEKI